MIYSNFCLQWLKLQFLANVFEVSIIKLKIVNKKDKWLGKKVAIFVRSQAKFILELNLLITQNGFSAVKNVGVLFQKKINISMEELEKILKNSKED